LSRILAVAVTSLGIGCLSQSSLDGLQLPPDTRQPGKVFAVRHQASDERGLDQTIVVSLRLRGLDAVAGDAKDPDYVVSYVDRWYWDMRMYLVDFRIDVRDARTNVLLATARSYQTSLAAMGETHQSIVERTVDVLIEGMEARLKKQEAAKRARPTRR
jgi:hypothetical protein